MRQETVPLGRYMIKVVLWRAFGPQVASIGANVHVQCAPHAHVADDRQAVADGHAADEHIRWASIRSWIRSHFGSSLWAWAKIKAQRGTGGDGSSDLNYRVVCLIFGLLGG